MSGKLLALYAFDEQLVASLRRVRGGEDEAERGKKPPTAEEVLDESGKLWPYVLKLLGDATATAASTTTAASSAMQKRFLVCLADRLVLAVRSIPVKMQERYAKDLTTKIADLEVSQERLLNAEIEAEKLKFFSTYSNTESDLHRATDYWSVWERETRISIQSRITETITNLKNLLTQANRELEARDSRQASIRDRWSDVRARLLYSSSPWWGSLRPASAVDEIPDWLNVSPALPLEELKLFASAVNRMQLLASVKSLEANPVWDAVKLSLATLVSLAQKSFEIGSRDPSEIELVTTPLVNVVDALLFLLFVRASEELQADARRVKNDLIEAEREIAEITEKLRSPESLLQELSMRDPVVMRFRADARTPLVEAALNHVLEMQKKRLAELLEIKRNFILTKAEEMKNFDSSKTKSFVDPWSNIWSLWKTLVGSSPDAVGLEKLLEIETDWKGVGTESVTDSLATLHTKVDHSSVLLRESSSLLNDALPPLSTSSKINEYL